MRTRKPEKTEINVFELIRCKNILAEPGILKRHKDLDKDIDSEAAKNKGVKKVKK